MAWTDIWTPEVQNAVVTALAAVLTIVITTVCTALKSALQAWQDKKLKEAEALWGMAKAQRVRALVEAAEQYLAAEGQKLGKEKYQQVVKWAQAEGLDISEADIEAAVYALKRQQRGA